MMLIGSGLGVLLVTTLIMLTIGLFTSGPVPLSGWPETAQRGVKDAGPAATSSPSTSEGSTGRPKAAPTTAGSPTQAASPTKPGNGNGNGHGRPSRTPGKP